MREYKITNRTPQSIQLLDKILKPRETVTVKELDEQLRALENKNLIFIKVIEK